MILTWLVKLYVVCIKAYLAAWFSSITPRTVYIEHLPAKWEYKNFMPQLNIFSLNATWHVQCKIAVLTVLDPINNWLVDFKWPQALYDSQYNPNWNKPNQSKTCTEDLWTAVSLVACRTVLQLAQYPVISASDLTTVKSQNSMHKYADDTLIVIPARNAQSREGELDHIARLAQSSLRISTHDQHVQ